MKCISLIGLFVGLIVWTFFSIPRNAERPSELLNSIKDKEWNDSEWISLSSGSFSNLLSNVSHNSELNLSESKSSKLVSKLIDWSNAYSGNSLDEFLKFRSPDSIEFTNSSLGFRLNWLVKYQNVETNNMSADALLKLAFDFESKSHLTDVSAGSFALSTKVIDNLNDDFLGSKIFTLYNGVWSKLGGNSPFKYKNSAEKIIRESGNLLVCSVSGAFHTSEDQNNPTPIRMFVFWSPRDKDWRPYTLYYLMRDDSDTNLKIFF